MHRTAWHTHHERPATQHASDTPSKRVGAPVQELLDVKRNAGLGRHAGKGGVAHVRALGRGQVRRPARQHLPAHRAGVTAVRQARHLWQADVHPRRTMVRPTQHDKQPQPQPPRRCTGLGGARSVAGALGHRGRPCRPVPPVQSSPHDDAEGANVRGRRRAPVRHHLRPIGTAWAGFVWHTARLPLCCATSDAASSWAPAWPRCRNRCKIQHAHD